MSDKWSERTWRVYGREDAYYAVCNEEAFRGARLDDAARQAFFDSGEAHVAWVLGAIRRTIDAEFAPARVFDFGCGVGRLLLPFARRAAEAVGGDVAPEMLEEARRNAALAGLTNVALVRTDDALSAVSGPFDLVHSFIVFQHIPPDRGVAIAMRLVDRLRPGGVGALHFTYAREAPLWRKSIHRVRRAVPGANAVVNLAQGRRAGEPLIPMYEYRLETLVESLRARGCGEVHALLTDHGGHRGAMLLFRVGGGE